MIKLRFFLLSFLLSTQFDDLHCLVTSCFNKYSLTFPFYPIN